MNNVTCIKCSKSFSLMEVSPLVMVREPLWQLIVADYPDSDRNGYICSDDLQGYKVKHLNEILQDDHGAVSKADQEVIDTLQTAELLSQNINDEYEDNLGLGERIADRVSTFGGSWRFIGIFFTFLLGWMILNTFILLQDQYDPYPYILLNLILSCLAAVQAPIIMMSQNRRAERDRIQAENDYKVNLKSEIQIRHLNMKLDKFMNTQWQALVEIQKAQTDIMSDINKSVKVPVKNKRA